MTRVNISSGTTWENTVGYSRAVRIGNNVEVAGTTAIENNEVQHKGDVYTQAKFVLHKIERALEEVGVSMKDVVRTRIYVTDISRWEEAGRAHGEFFRDIKPAATMVQVNALIHPDLLIEIEATAIVS